MTTNTAPVAPKDNAPVALKDDYPYWRVVLDYVNFIGSGAKQHGQQQQRPTQLLSWKWKHLKHTAFLFVIFYFFFYSMYTLQPFRNEKLAAYPPDPIVRATTETQFAFFMMIPAISLFFFADYHSWMAYTLVYLIPLNVYVNANRGNFFEIFFLVFGLIPVLELTFENDTTNPSHEESQELTHNKIFHYIPMIWVPIQYGLIFWGCYAAATWELSWTEYCLFFLGIGVNSGVLGINIAHELIHKNNFWEQNFGKALLISCCYGHFFVEHLLGHHRKVSTPDDPASSRRNETFYSFYPRTVVGSWLSAWELEKERLAKFKIGAWSIYNQLLHFLALSALIALSVYYLWGWKALGMFLGQSWFGFSLLELVNYIEHYGLRRRKTEKGYEAVRVVHSWNSDTRVTNFFLFKLQRHSDHHAHASRRYQTLRSFAASPQMPTGYGGMILIALFPPLWFRIMNPLLDSWGKKMDEIVQQE